MRRFLLRFIVSAAAFVLTAATVPRWWCGRDGPDLYEGRSEPQIRLARAVARWVTEEEVSPASFSTGSARFDGEWTVGTYQMAALGLGQVALEHPDHREELLPAIDLCIKRLLEPSTRRFGTAAWGEDGLESLENDRGHAYLGYLALAMSMQRLLGGGSPHKQLHDRLIGALGQRIQRSPTGLYETYPAETYPIDVSATVGAIGLHGMATGADHSPLIRRWSALARDRYVDPGSGLLFQSVDVLGEPLDGPRASGTALAAYFLSFADRDLSAELFDALSDQHVTFLGFGGIREYPDGVFGLGDVDSGPVLFGVGISASGFAIAGARIHQDRQLYTSLYRTVHLFGAPHRGSHNTRFLTGGPLGNAIMLAMLTAQGGGQA